MPRTTQQSEGKRCANFPARRTWSRIHSSPLTSSRQLRWIFSWLNRCCRSCDAFLLFQSALRNTSSTKNYSFSISARPILASSSSITRISASLNRCKMSWQKAPLQMQQLQRNNNLIKSIVRFVNKPVSLCAKNFSSASSQSQETVTKTLDAKCFNSRSYSFYFQRLAWNLKFSKDGWSSSSWVKNSR